MDLTAAQRKAWLKAERTSLSDGLYNWIGNQLEQLRAGRMLRDVLANAGGFTLPPFVEPLLEGRVADPKTTAQLLVPAAINLVSSPVHLLGLSLYNNPSFGALEHVAGVAAVYVSVTVSRVMKGFCAYGLGGVSNTALRAKFGSG